MQKFKIVQTIEKGEYKLSAVPESWENLGNLRWPKVKWEKLRRDPYSKPEDNWRSIDCILKRKDIMSFREAEAELSAMSDATDTDQENITYNIPSKRQNKETDFNKLAHQCLETQAQIHTSPSASKNRLNQTKSLQTAVDSNKTTASKERIESDIQEYLVYSQKSTNYQPEAVQPVQSQIHRSPSASKNRLNQTKSLQTAVDSNKTTASKERIESDIQEYVVYPQKITNNQPEAVQPVQVQAYEYGENEVQQFNSEFLITHEQEETSKEFGEQQASIATSKENAKLNSLETKVDNFIANQYIIALNQEQIMQKLSDISAQFDEFIKRSSLSNLTRKEHLNKGIKNIANEEGLNELEELLKDKHKVDEMTKIYSVLCGQGKGRAINNAYALSDAMFDRNFLKQCSWAGGSRGDTSKICFKSYKRTINFFFKIIHASDKQFTILECESFLKNILRNANKRCESKQLKRSAQKKRQKREELENKENKSLVNANGEAIINEERGSVSEENSERRLAINEVVLANQELENEFVTAQDLPFFQETVV